MGWLSQRKYNPRSKFSEELIGLDFRAYRRNNDRKKIDAILWIYAYSVMQNIADKLARFNIPYKIVVNKQYYSCIIVTEVKNLAIDICINAAQNSNHTKKDALENLSKKAEESGYDKELQIALALSKIG